MILVTGATGTVGSALVKQLSKQGVSFRALVRNPAKTEALKLPGVELVQGDLSDQASFAHAVAGVDKLFLLITSAPGADKTLAAAIGTAKAAGVKHIVRLSVNGAAADSPVALSRWHAQTEKDLKESGLPWTILQPTYFMQNLLGAAATIKGQGAFFGAAGEGKVSMIDARDIAAAAAKTLTTEGHAHKTYVLTGAEALSFADAAKLLSSTIGKPVNYVNLPPEGYEKALVSAGLPAWYAADLTTMNAFMATGGGAAVDPSLGQLIGSVRRFPEFARDFAAAFKN